MVFITVTKAFFNILINHYRSDLCIAFSTETSCRAYCPPAVVGQTRAERRNILRVSVSHWVIDAILAVNVLPSLYFQMFHHAMYMIMIIIYKCNSFMHMYNC